MKKHLLAVVAIAALATFVWSSAAGAAGIMPNYKASVPVNNGATVNVTLTGATSNTAVPSISIDGTLDISTKYTVYVDGMTKYGKLTHHKVANFIPFVNGTGMWRVHAKVAFSLGAEEAPVQARIVWQVMHTTQLPQTSTALFTQLP